MKEFRVTARRQSGETVTRVLRAPSQQAVKQLLEKQEWHIVEIEEQIRESLWKKRIRRNRPLKARVLSHLFQQLAEMMRSGIPFVEAWRLLILEVSRRSKTSCARSWRRWKKVWRLRRY
jgi:type II secretory pathway component PulF